MHTPETQQKFIELRSREWTYDRIAAELGVAKSTLIEWSRKFRFDINNRLALEVDELRHRILGPRQARVNVLAQKLARIEEELRKRDLTQVSTARLFSLADSLRRQLERETSAMNFVSPVKDIPNDEYVEQIQQWKP
jgi:transcriptional regulator with XRE-family HTH domain